MKKLHAFFLLCAPGFLFAQDVDVKIGEWKLYDGTHIIVDGLSSEKDCIDAALISGEGSYGCRTITRVTVSPTPTPEPAPPSVYRGIPDPSTHLGFDVYADCVPDLILDQDYSANAYTVTATGTTEKPFCVDATKAKFKKLTIAGEYIIFKGGLIVAPVNRGAWLQLSAPYSVVKDIELIGPKANVGAASAVLLSNDSVLLRAKIHGFGDSSTDAAENDYHGVKTTSNTNTWILDCEIFDNGGDSVQVGDASRGAASNVYIGGGFFYNNKENAVDIKDSTNIIVSGVTAYGFAPSASSDGTAMVVHDDAFGAKFYDNKITDSNKGIKSTGVSGHIIDGNNINARVAIECRNTNDVTIINNQAVGDIDLGNCS